MKDVFGKWLPVVLVTAAVALLPLAGQVHAVPGKGLDCYRVECHTLGAAMAAPVGKGVQDVLFKKLTNTPTDPPPTGIFERNRLTPAPHTFGAAQWTEEGRCLGCHTSIQGELLFGNLNMSEHPIYSTTGTGATQNHITCNDCHAAATTNDNYHVAELGNQDDSNAWLRASGQALCNLCHAVTGLSGTIGSVGGGFRLQRDPVNVHGLTGYDTATWTTCSDFGDSTPYSTGCHNSHAVNSNDGLVGATDYNLTNQTTAGFCASCHPAQDSDATAYNNKHDFDTTDYNLANECTVCHSFTISTSDQYLTAGFHTDASQLVKMIGGSTTAANDLFCLQCHDGSYPLGFSGWQGGAKNGGGAPLVDVDGDNSNWGYNINGHGVDTGSFSPAAWKTPGAPAVGNPNPVTEMPANFTAARTCYTCHDPHATTNRYIIKSTVNANAVTIDGTANDSTSCTACHNGTADIDTTGANPATSLFQELNKADYDASAHAITGGLSCYGDYDSAAGGNTRTGCHDPHGTGTGVTPWKGMAIAGNEEAGCTGTAITGCHGATPAAGTFNKHTTGGELSLASHHPVTANGTLYNADAINDEVECTNCHNPHIATLANPVINPDAVTTVAANAASPGAPVPDFDKFTDFCVGCHDGAPAPAGYGVTGALLARNHWGPGSGYAPSENTAFTTQCWNCHDSHGSNSIHLVGNTSATNPGANRGANPLLPASRSIYNVYDAVWSTKALLYSSAAGATNSLDPTAAGSAADGTNNTAGTGDDGVCDRCHRTTRGDNATHADVYAVNCVQATCHVHDGTIGVAAYPTAFPMLSPNDCFACHSSATSNRYQTASQFLVAHGGTMANGTDHNVTVTTDANNNCYRCHLLTDGTYPHKSGTVALKVGGQPTIYSTAGDYKVISAAPATNLASAVQFCLYCHGDTLIADSAANLTGFTSGNTPQVQIGSAGVNYRTYGHGASASLSGSRVGSAPPALECATCHQYHGGTVTQSAPRTIVNTANNAAMIELAAHRRDDLPLHQRQRHGEGRLLRPDLPPGHHHHRRPDHLLQRHRHHRPLLG